MTVELNDPIFHNEDKARAHLELIRWPDGPFCPHCGETQDVTRLEGKKHRAGLLQCNSCRGHFSVTVGTVMERSHIALHKWVLAFHLMNASKKGISAHQLHRMLGITYKSAWFMEHRIREAMKRPESDPVGGTGKPVEMDETYIGRDPTKKKRSGGHHKLKVLSLVERGGEVRSFHIKDLNKETVLDVLTNNVSLNAALMTDDSSLYVDAHHFVSTHDSVNHSAEEYVRGDVHTNTIEGYFSVFKRGMRGVYQHCAPKHLQRYLTEFDFRYSNRAALGINDTMRAARAIRGAAGKRLTYRQPRNRAHV
jgi:transposase-like protein